MFVLDIERFQRLTLGFDKGHNGVAKTATNGILMQFVSYRDLRNEPSALRKKLASEGELIVTVDNRPFAAMLNLGDENVQDILLMASRLCAKISWIKCP
jgi:hypothetical protein